MHLRLDLELHVRDRVLLSAKLDSAASAWVLSGPSGSGKSSLLRALAGVSESVAGAIEVDGTAWLSGATRVPPWQRRVGWMPQDSALFPHLSVSENLRFGHHATASGPALPDVARALRLEGLLDRRPRHLSGGEKQRVALGRALLSSPRLLLLDEPFSALDRSLRAHVIDAVSVLCRRWSLPAIIVSHDMRDLDHLSGVWLEVSDGRLCSKEAP